MAKVKARKVPETSALCRDLQHAWMQLRGARTGTHEYTRVLICTRKCGVERHETITVNGRSQLVSARSTYVYPKNGSYQIKGGALSKDERAMLKIRNIVGGN